VVKQTRSGLVLQGGGTDIDESFQWMIERSGGAISSSSALGTDAYNTDIYAMTAANGLRADRPVRFYPDARGRVRPLRHPDDPQRRGALARRRRPAKHFVFWRGTPVADAIQQLSRGGACGWHELWAGRDGRVHLLGRGRCRGRAFLDLDGHSPRSVPPAAHPAQGFPSPARSAVHDPGVALRSGEPLRRMAASWRGSRSSAGRLRGIGIDRKTALLVEPDGSARVINGPDHAFGRSVSCGSRARRGDRNGQAPDRARESR